MFSLAIASSLLPVSAQTMQNGSMQGSPMQGGSMQNGLMQNGSMQNGSMQNGSMQGSPMQSGDRHASLNAVDRQFITKAAQSDMTEIQTSQLALKRSQNPQVRQFAQEMIQQHTQSSNKLKPLASQKSVGLPTSLGAENQALLTQLTKLSGTKFDQAYMSGQAKAHAKTQAVYQNEVKQGQDTDVKAFARQVLPVVTAHLRMAQGMVAGR
jgi:putative membrane protein